MRFLASINRPRAAVSDMLATVARPWLKPPRVVAAVSSYFLNCSKITFASSSVSLLPMSNHVPFTG